MVQFVNCSWYASLDRPYCLNVSIKAKLSEISSDTPITLHPKAQFYNIIIMVDVTSRLPGILHSDLYPTYNVQMFTGAR